MSVAKTRGGLGPSTSIRKDNKMEYQRENDQWPFAELTIARLTEMKMAAREGSALALFDLGKLYDEGEKLAPRDNALAVRYYKEASEYGYAPASIVLGHTYHLGLFGEKVALIEAWKYFALAVKQGDTSASCQMRYVEIDLEGVYDWAIAEAETDITINKHLADQTKARAAARRLAKIKADYAAMLAAYPSMHDSYADAPLIGDAY